MKTSEIRVCNLFQHNDEWNTFGHKGVFTWTEDEWYALLECTMLIDNVEPIPLTEEWLTKLSNNIQEESCMSKKLFILNSEYCITWSVWGKCFYFQSEISDAGCYHLRPVHFVHQLQNLYYALTGEELVCS